MIVCLQIQLMLQYYFQINLSFVVEMRNESGLHGPHLFEGSPGRWGDLCRQAILNMVFAVALN